MTSRALAAAALGGVVAAASMVLACSATPAAEPVSVADPEPAAASATSSPVVAYLDDPEAVAYGRRYFRAVCTGYCHTTQPGVARDAPDLFDCEWLHGSSDAELFQVISQGVPDTEMLPFGGKLDPEVLWKIIAFLRDASRCGSS